MRSCALTEPIFMEDATLNYMRSMESFLKYFITRLTYFVVVLQVESVGMNEVMKIFLL